MSSLSQTAPNKFAELRKFGRRQTFKSASIVLKSGDVLRCVVIDESVEGAGLKLDGVVCPDDAFDLVIEEDDVRVACRVAHRSGDKMGVQFISLPRRASRRGLVRSDPK